MSRVRVPDGVPRFGGQVWPPSSVWLVGQAVKTPASHAGNGGSIPPRVTLKSTVEKLYEIVGVDDVEGTPVPIPNTEVKLNGAEDT